MTREDYTPEDAIEQGRKDAQENIKKANARSNTAGGQDPIAEGQATAKENHEAEQKYQREITSNELSNDTSKKSKVETAKSQLNPSGDEPISDKDIAKSSTNASEGSGTQVSSADQAQRAVDANKDVRNVDSEPEDDPSTGSTEADNS